MLADSGDPNQPALRRSLQDYAFEFGALLAGGAIAFATSWGGLAWWALAGILTLVALWVAYFFRDPERVPPDRPGLVVAPADGVVVSIQPAAPPLELGLGDAPRWRVACLISRRKNSPLRASSSPRR